MAESSFIRVSQRETLTRLESKVRDQAAACDDVLVLADHRTFRQLRRLRDCLEREPVPGYSVKVWNRPDGGGILAISDGPFWSGAQVTEFVA